MASEPRVLWEANGLRVVHAEGWGVVEVEWSAEDGVTWTRHSDDENYDALSEAFRALHARALAAEAALAFDRETLRLIGRVIDGTPVDQTGTPERGREFYGVGHARYSEGISVPTVAAGVAALSAMARECGIVPASTPDPFYRATVR